MALFELRNAWFGCQEELIKKYTGVRISNIGEEHFLEILQSTRILFVDEIRDQPVNYRAFYMFDGHVCAISTNLERPQFWMMLPPPKSKERVKLISESKIR